MWIEVRCGEQCLFILFVLSGKSIGILNSEISKSAFIHRGRSSIIFGLCLCRKISKPLERNAQKTISSVNIVDMSNILGKHVHSVEIQRNFIWGIAFKKCSCKNWVTDGLLKFLSFFLSFDFIGRVRGTGCSRRPQSSPQSARRPHPAVVSG